MIWSDPLVNKTAPDQSPSLGTSTTEPLAPVMVEHREPVTPVLEVHHRTVSAGEETAPIPLIFDRPIQRMFRNIYGRLTAGYRTTLLAPELQSEIAPNADDSVFPVKGMNTPYIVREPGAWYESFTRRL